MVFPALNIVFQLQARRAPCGSQPMATPAAAKPKALVIPQPAPRSRTRSPHSPPRSPWGPAKPPAATEELSHGGGESHHLLLASRQVGSAQDPQPQPAQTSAPLEAAGGVCLEKEFPGVFLPLWFDPNSLARSGLRVCTHHIALENTQGVSHECSAPSSAPRTSARG